MPQNVSKMCMLFLKVPNTLITAEVIRERINRGGGYGLEFPVMYCFYGPEKLINCRVFTVRESQEKNCLFKKRQGKSGNLNLVRGKQEVFIKGQGKFSVLVKG